MSLPVPEYVSRASIDSPKIHFEWDDFGDQLEDDYDADLEDVLNAVTQRAVLGFMCGDAEWLVYRFSGLLSDPGPGDFLAASWAMTVDLRYRGLSWNEYAGEHWTGPIQRPIHEGLELLETALERVWNKEDDPATFATRLSMLTEYVLPEVTAYRSWRDATLQRLSASCRRDYDDDPGDPIPREALDPQIPFDPDASETQINRFLASLESARNPFLRSAADMQAGNDEFDAFAGQPYTFDLNDDRAQRRHG